MNKYSRWYFALVEKARGRTIVGYTEKHHVYPESFGGTKRVDNLVRLTAREHFICHWLLTKCTVGECQRKMLFALHKMTHVGKSLRTPTSWQYEIARKASSKAMKGNTRGLGNKVWSGKRHSDETKAQMRISATGKKRPWVKVTTARLNSTRQTCDHCNRQFNPGNFGRHHGDRCKMRKHAS